ncbi:MAG: TolC family protein [Bacteroidia bacterium]|nr:TolC family protein [Bacteroidia bacterium]
MKKFSFIKLIFLFPLLFAAQDKLTLEKAIEIALKNNYSITIAKNESAIAKNNVTRGNAGFLPDVTINSAMSFSSNDTKQEFNNGGSVNKKGAQSQSTSTGVALNWILFDGMKMFATYNKLKDLNGMGEANAKMQIENTLVQVIEIYYDVVRQKQLILAADSTLAIYNERVKISETKWKIGKSAKTDLLQAQVDRNAQRSVKLKLNANLSVLKIKLNQLLIQKSETEFDVEDEIKINETLALDEMKNKAVSQNTSLLYYKKNISMNEFTLKETRSFYYPKIGFVANYNFAKTTNQAGLLLFSRNLGWNTGITASWNIFSGFNHNRNTSNAKISVLDSKLMFDDKKTEIESSVQLYYKNYSAALELLKLEEETTQLAKENAQVSLERFRLGEATTLEIKEAQKSYEDAMARLVQARYDAKVAETELMKLKGELVK